ncbi:hypothetical protein MHI24_14100 [Paenibacillus sp. FSL K6-1096]|uniref:hypothetical protein n=1 Tax=Paenibacillus sp. FSL K6-1096 TaxID=2921460 RepID=UPI0030ED4B25
MERKVSKFGNSLGINLTDALKRMGSTKTSLAVGISPDFMIALTDAIEEYDQTLQGLKDR